MQTSEAWDKAQELELQWHMANQWRANDQQFLADTERHMRRFGFHPSDYESVIDAGCGPRLRSRYFKAKLYAIDPLANDYMRAFPWCDLNTVTTYSVPLEQFIPDLRAEFLMSLNCLDHCADFDKAVSNMARYAEHLFLSYDCGEANAMHPLRLDEAISERTFMQHGLKITAKVRGDPWRAGIALNYWLERG